LILVLENFFWLTLQTLTQGLHAHSIESKSHKKRLNFYLPAITSLLRTVAQFWSILRR